MTDMERLERLRALLPPFQSPTHICVTAEDAEWLLSRAEAAARAESDQKALEQCVQALWSITITVDIEPIWKQANETLAGLPDDLRERMGLNNPVEVPDWTREALDGDGAGA